MLTYVGVHRQQAKANKVKLCFVPRYQNVDCVKSTRDLEYRLGDQNLFTKSKNRETL